MNEYVHTMAHIIMFLTGLWTVFTSVEGPVRGSLEGSE